MVLCIFSINYILNLLLFTSTFCTLQGENSYLQNLREHTLEMNCNNPEIVYANFVKLTTIANLYMEIAMSLNLARFEI